MSTPTNGTGSSSSSNSGHGGGGGSGGGHGGGGGHTSNSIQNSSPTYPSNISSTMIPSVASRIKKNLNRTKEKILQGIGKTDRTSDESFDSYVENFERQHAQASKLAKELNKYVNNLKETHKSSKAFYETLRETFEPHWPGSDAFSDQVQLADQKWSDYLVRLSNDVQSPLAAYLNEFPELKKKIEKRDNRLLDYDNARHTLEAVQSKTLKKSNSGSNGNGGQSTASHDHLTKITKLKIDLEDKQHIYEEINQTLCLSLPVLYENRIKFYASLFQTFFHTETLFNSDLLEVKTKLDEICENLSIQSLEVNTDAVVQQHHSQQQQQQQSLARPDSKTGRKLERAGSSVVDYSSHEAEKTSNGSGGVNGRHNGSSNGGLNGSANQRANSMYVKPSSAASIRTDSQSNNSLSSDAYQNGVNSELDSAASAEQQSKNARRSSASGTNSKYNPAFMHAAKTDAAPVVKSEFVPDSVHIAESIIVNKNGHGSSPSASSVVVVEQEHVVLHATAASDSSRTSKLSPTSERENGASGVVANGHTNGHSNGGVVKTSALSRVCYKVKATYGYEGKELDELTFSKDDVIFVVEGTESEKEDLDDGWLIGIHEVSSRRGLFPENFTKKI